MTDGTKEQERDPEVWLGEALRRHADAFDRVGPEPDDIIAEGRRRVRRRKAGAVGVGTGGLALAVAAGLVFIGSPAATQVPVQTEVSSSPTASFDDPFSAIVGRGTIDGETWTVSGSYSPAQGWCFGVAYGEASAALGCQTEFFPEPTADIGKPWVSILFTGAGFAQNGSSTLPCDYGVVVYRSADVTSISMTAYLMSRVTEKPVSFEGRTFTAFVAPLKDAAYTSTGVGGKAGPTGANVLSGIPGSGACGSG